MKINRIGFGYTKSLGNYENCKIWLEADLEDWEDPSESLNQLRDRVAQELNLPDKWHDLKGKFNRQSQALEATNAALQKAEKRWERYKNFLVSHGVDPDSLLINGYPFTSAYAASLIGHGINPEDLRVNPAPSISLGEAAEVVRELRAEETADDDSIPFCDDDDDDFDPYYSDEYYRIHDQAEEPENLEF